MHELLNVRVSEGVVDDGAHNKFEVDEQVLEGDEVELGFNVCIFGQVTAGERFLGAEGGRDAEDVAERGEAGFEVELRRLRQIRLFAVVIEGEERGTAFNLRLHHAGWRHFETARFELVVRFPKGTEDCGANFYDGGRDFAAEYKMAVVIEGLRVCVWSDAGGDGFFVAGRFANDLEVVGVEFSVVRGMLLWWYLPHLTIYFH